MRDFFDPTLEETTILNVSAATKRKAAKLILGCEDCSDDAEIPFDYVLDWVTGLDPAVTDYVLSEPAKCPKCRGDVTEKTRWSLGTSDAPPRTILENKVPRKNVVS